MKLALLLIAVPALGDVASEPVKAAPAGVTISGTLVDGRRFFDNNGENVVLITKRGHRPNEQLYVYHFARGGRAGYTLVRKLSDGVSGCDEDIVLAPVGSIEVTDLDGDGLDEVTLAYTVGCRGDMSPVAMKLMLLVNGEKYAMRGEQEMYVRKKSGALELNNPWPTKPPEWEPHLYDDCELRRHMQSRWDRDKKWVFAKE